MYVIKHKTRGIYVEHEMIPSFTPTVSKAKKFESKEQAEGLISLFDMQDCIVEPLKDGPR